MWQLMAQQLQRWMACTRPLTLLETLKGQRGLLQQLQLMMWQWPAPLLLLPLLQRNIGGYTPSKTSHLQQ
jgi:hypothetical protein